MPYFRVVGREKGFTLIEILVVVAIVAILSSMVLLGLGPTRRAGHDARRISDIRHMQTALELYFNKCGYYPGRYTGTAPCTAYNPTSAYNDATCSARTLCGVLTASGFGISSVPDDPIAGTHYVYTGLTGGTGYVLGATLEDATNPVLRTDVDSVVGGVNCNDPTYCVQV